MIKGYLTIAGLYLLFRMVLVPMATNFYKQRKKDSMRAMVEGLLFLLFFMFMAVAQNVIERGLL